jgi:ketosteroid isomerase-like protein
MKDVASAKLMTVDVQPLGTNAAQEIGSFTLATKAQPPQTVAGKYVVIWRKAGGDWKLATDIWNMNK